jgi:hypothetical protein
MKKLMLLCGSLLATAFFTATTPVHAQNLSWVSPFGSDSNSCAQTSPCATFAGAISKGGVAQINCEGSGNYGTLNSTTVSITGSIIIDCGAGNVGEMTAGGGSQVININASSAVTIVLRHLSLNGGGNVVFGINTQNFASGTLIIENCMIHGARSGGIKFTPSSGRGTLQVTDSLLYDNGDSTITVNPASGQIASIALNRVEIIGNDTDGLDLVGPGIIAGTIRQSLVAENVGAGIFANASGGVFFTVDQTSVVDNLLTGIEINSPAAIVNVGASTIGGNGTGVQALSGSLVSFGNNQMSANGTNGSFTSTTPLQ